jgi:hypothetical protein
MNHHVLTLLRYREMQINDDNVKIRDAAHLKYPTVVPDCALFRLNTLPHAILAVNQTEFLKFP